MKFEDIRKKYLTDSSEVEKKESKAEPNNPSKIKSTYEEIRKKYGLGDTAETEPLDTENGKQGWQKYLDDQNDAIKAAQPKKEDESFWDKLGRWLGGGGAVDTSVPLSGMPQITHDMSEDTTSARPNEDWTDAQKYAFGDLYLSDPQKAYKYAEETNKAINKAKEEEAKKKIQDNSTSSFWSGVGNTLGAIATAPLGLADFLYDLAMANAGGEITPDGNISPFEYSQAVTEGISTHLNEYGTLDESIPLIGGKGWGDLYGLGTSIAQSQIYGNTLGKVGGTAATLISYFGQSASSGVKDAKKRGASDDQALLYGAALGLWEAIPEAFAFDKLFSMESASTISGFFKNIYSQAGVEFLEEGATSLGSLVSDLALMQDKSNFNEMVAGYMELGLSKEEAQKKAWLELGEGVLFDAVAGAVSGGVGGALNTGKATIASNYDAKKNYGDRKSVEELLGEAAELGTDTDRKAVDKYVDKYGKNGKLSGWNISHLIEITDTAKMKNATEAKLTQLGEQGDVSKLADALVKQTQGYELSKSEKKLIEESTYGQRVANTLDPEKIRSGEYETGWAEEIGTRRINPREYNKALYDLAVQKAMGDIHLPDDDSEEKKATTSGEFTVKNATDVSDKISESGKTTISSTGESVTINKDNAIAKIKMVNGERVVYYNTDHGVVESSDIKYGNEAEGLLYEAFVDMNPAFANAIIKNYDGSVPVQTYINGMREGVIVYGMHNFQEVGKDISGASDLAELSKADQDFALKLGRAYAKSDAKKVDNKRAAERAEASKETSSTEGAKKTSKKGAVRFEKGVKPKTRAQRRIVSLAKHLARAMGIDIVFYDATIEGTYGSDANGFFDEETNTIHLDMQNSKDDAKTIAFTLAHELVHFIKKHSPSKFNTFAKFLMEQYAAHGEDSSKLLANKMAELGTTDADFAYEEMICDACETMLLDSNAVVKLMELRKQDLNLFETIKLHILKLLEKIRTEYRRLGLEPTSDEAKALLKMEDVLSQIHAMFEDALVEATQNYQTVQELNTDSVSVTEDGTIKMQMKQYRQTGRSTLLRYLKEKYGDADANNLISTIDTIYNTMAEIKQDTPLSVFGNWQDTEFELDAEGHPIFTTSIKNGDYELNQDFSRVCKKRRQLDFVLNMLAEDPAFEASNLTKQDFVKINNAIKKHGFEIACALCFVDSKRFRQAEWADSFANTWNDILNAVVVDSSKLTPFNFATKNPNVADEGIEIDTSKPVTYRKWSDGKEDVKNRRTYDSFDAMLSKEVGEDGKEKWLEGNTNVRTIASLIRDNPALRHTFRGADIIASKGFDTMQRLAPGIRSILDGWGGSSVPKPSSNDASYDSSIINMSEYNKETAYAMGGARMNSFSDFMAHMFFDYCQAFADLSAKELPSQAYTKELLYVRLFGRSGQKQNMSGIPAIRDDSLPTTAIKGVTKAQAEANEKIEKMIAGLDVTRLLEHLNKDILELTASDVEQFLDMCDYVWADESINMKHATLLQTGILYDKLSESKIEECYELLKAGEIEQALKVAGKQNVDTEYAKHCGTIVVGVSDAHIRKLLRDPTVRMVIPYHKSGLNPIIARELKIAAYNDYTSVQNTGVVRKGATSRVNLSSEDIKKSYALKDFDFYEWFGKTIDGKLYDGKATADKYIEWCENGYYDQSVGDYVYYTNNKKGYILASDLHKKLTIKPKFDAFIGEDNYYKVLEDFDCYDTITGEHSAQGAVDFFNNGLPSDYKNILVGALNEEQKVHDDFRDHLDNKGLKDEIMDIVGNPESKKSIKKQAKKTQGNIYDYSKSFAEQIDDYKKGLISQNDSLLVSGTPDVWQKVGFNALPVTINQTHVDYALNGTKDHEHHIGETLLKDLPNAIQSPIAIIQSQSPNRSDRAVVILKMTHAGKNVIGAVEVDGYGRTNNIRIDSNAMASLFAKTNALTQLNNAINNTVNGGVELFYWNKKEAMTLLQRAGLQLSSGLPQDGFVHSIHDNGSNVKTKFKNVVETQQFKRWFGDWQNDPKHASKVVNDDGTPRVVYHGTNADFSVFDIERAGKNWNGDSRLGKGFYFAYTEHEALQWTEGTNVIKAYLNLRNPLNVDAPTPKNIAKEIDKYIDNKIASFDESSSFISKEQYIKNLQRIKDMYMNDVSLFIDNFKYDDNGKMTDGIREFLSSLGYDGIISKDEVVAFYPEQIKSATDNIGTFDPNTPNIRYQKKKDSQGNELSAEQQEYFKDSKVRDKKGNLMVLYHGTTANFNTFKKGDVGFHFGTKGAARGRVGYGKNTILKEVYLNITNPIVFDEDLGSWDADWRLTRELYDMGILSKEDAESILFTDNKLYKRTTEAANKKLASVLLDKGYDGIAYSNTFETKNQTTSYIVFNSNQAKEITNTSPTSDPDIRYQKKKLSNRTILANALESTIDTSTQEGQNELKMLKQYQSKIDLIEKEEAQLAEINAQIKEISFGKGTDRSKLKGLNEDKVMCQNRLHTYDKQLTRLESMKPIKDVLAREKELVRKRTEEKGREALRAYKEESQRIHKEQIGQMRIDKKKAVDKVRETRDKNDAKAKLQKLVLETSKWLSYPAKDDVKCPDILREPYAKFLEGIDLSSKRLLEGGEPTQNDIRLSNAMSSLATAIERIRTAQDPSVTTDQVLDSGYLDLPANFVEKLRTMAEDISKMMVKGDYVINQMSSTDIKQISQLIRTLNNAIKKMSTLYSNLRFANVEELGDNTMTFLDSMGEAKGSNSVIDFVGWDNALPYYAFKRFGEGGESVFTGLMDAQDKLANHASTIFEFKDKTWSDEEANEWGKDTHTITLPSGNSLTLTTADAMGIYCLSRREQGLQHLLGGGTRVIGIKKGAKKASDSRSTLTQEDLNAIISSLTERQKKVAKAIQDFMSTTCADWGNEISMKRFLTRDFTDPNYYPIESNDENLSTKDPQAQQTDLYRLLNISATKPLTPGANNEVIIRNIFEVFTEHTSDMARLNAFGMPLLDYMKWLNYREKIVNDEGQIIVKGVRKSMETTYGAKARSYVINLIKDINGRHNDNGDNTFLMNMMRMAKTASVGGNLRVAFLQFTSYPRARMVLSTGSLVKGLTKVPQISKAKKYCGIALWKSFGFYDTNIARSIEDQIKGSTNIRQKIIEFSMKGAEWADAITWGALWNACEYEVAKTTKNKVGSEEFNKEVGLKLREVVYATQVVDSVLTRSQIMRSKSGLTQTATAFMSEPTLTSNILMDAGFQFYKEKRITGSAKTAWKKTGKIVCGAVANYCLLQLLTSLAESLADAWRDDDDEDFAEKFMEAFGENFITNIIPFNKIPIISDIAELILSRFGIGFVSSDNLATTWITQIADAMDVWSEVLGEGLGGEETSKTVYNAIYKTAKAISSLSGVSASGVMREVVALWNNTAGAFDPSLKIKSYESTNEELGNELYEAIIEGNDSEVEIRKSQFEDEDSMNAALRKALRENDSRIKEAAQAKYDGNISEYTRIAKEIVAEGNFSQDMVVGAVNAEVSAIKKAEALKNGETAEADTTEDKAISYYSASDVSVALEHGDTNLAKQIINDLINTKVANGMTTSEAKSSIKSSLTSYWKPLYKQAYQSGDTAEMTRIRRILASSGLYGKADDVIKTTKNWLKA